MPSAMLKYEDLAPGFEFSPTTYMLEPKAVAAYLRAVRESSGLFPAAQDTDRGYGGMVPPTAVAALAIRSLMGKLTLPPGSIHLSQELRFFRPVRVGETVTCRARVAKKHERAGLRLLTVDLSVFDGAGARVQFGQALITVPGAT